MAPHRDGINWIKCGKDLIENNFGRKTNVRQVPMSFSLTECYHMFFSYRYNLNFKNKYKGYRIGYAFLMTLINWIRDDAKAGIDVSDNGWDSESISYPHVFELDDNIYMLYQGNQIGRYGFGLAQLEDYTSLIGMDYMKWKKLGKIFDPTKYKLPNNCVEFAQSPQTLVFDDFIRIYFSHRKETNSENT